MSVELYANNPAGGLVTLQDAADKDQANGYPGLDANARIAQARLGTGSDGSGTHFLADDQTYKASGASGISTLILFDSTLGADAANIDTGANGIAQTAESLLVMILARTSEATTISTVAVTLNNDSGANYDRNQMTVTNTTVAGGVSLAAASWSLGVDGDSQEAGAATLLHLLMHGYRQTTFHKSALALHNMPDDTAANNRIQFDGLRWKSTAAVSRLKVAAGSGNLRAGSRLTIYGLL